MPRRRRSPRAATRKRPATSGPTSEERASWGAQNAAKAALGWYLDSQGYVARTVRVKGKRVTQREHRVVMEQMIGRKLVKGETVHHRNGTRHDNTPSNLELWVTHQPAGQRPHELLEYAYEIIARYGHAGDQGNTSPPLPL